MSEASKSTLSFCLQQLAQDVGLFAQIQQLGVQDLDSHPAVLQASLKDTL